MPALRASAFMNGPVFAVLFAVYPVLFIMAANPGQGAPATVAVVLAAFVIASVVLLAIAHVVFRSWSRAGLSVTLIVFLFYVYGPAHTSIDAVILDSVGESSSFALRLQSVSPYLHSMMTTVWIAVGLLVLRSQGRIPERRIPQLVQALNVMAVVLIGLVTVQLVTRLGPRAVPHAAVQSVISGHPTVSVLGYNPDIYVIVLDGYARGDVLRQHYQFDNSEFLNGLSARGFQVSGTSTANYNWTFLSLASVLNMDYVQNLDSGRVSPASADRAPLYEAVRDNTVARFLKGHGYRIIHLQSTWGATIRNPYADEEVACHHGVSTDEFVQVLAEASWLKVFQPRMSADLAECHLSNLESLAGMGAQPGPKYVFVHFIPPHHPYLFDRKGRILREATLSNEFAFQQRLWEEKASYVDQLVYMNHRITETIDRILSVSARPPIVIVQSDHGPNIDQGMTRDEHLRIRFANLAAYLLPRAPEQLMPDDVSGVNQFRYLFNHYFNARLEILPNRHYSSEFRTPYSFEDVTLSRYLPE